MTTIPNLNIVIQQGDSARESQNIRNQALESSQHAAAERLEGEDKKRTVVPETEETDRILFNKEKSNEQRNRGGHQEQKKEKKKDEDDVPDPDSTGRLLNTVV